MLVNQRTDPRLYVLCVCVCVCVFDPTYHLLCVFCLFRMPPAMVVKLEKR